MHVRGIHLAPPRSEFVGGYLDRLGRAGLPANLGSIPGSVRDAGRMPSLPRALALAARFHLPAVWRVRAGLSSQPVAPDVFAVSASKHGDGGYHLRQDPNPVEVWLAAAWYVTNQKQGVSALGLQRALGLKSYQTAWTMLHRLRRAMVRLGREPLHGRVEIDETYIAITDRGSPRSAAERAARPRRWWPWPSKFSSPRVLDVSA
jgi:hypothetical protein